MTKLSTRKPTGKPPWPMLLLAGMEKSGKSYAAAAASASELIDRTFWLTCGEDDPDEYAPLGRFEIVEQPGTHRALVDSIQQISRLPVATKPHMIVVDSISMLWMMLTDEVQHIANERARKKGRANTTEAPVSPDLWNLAAGRWRQVMNALRAHHGPVLLTARLNQVAVMDDRGEPTKDRIWKIEGHKTLPYDMTAIVQMRSRSEIYLTGVRSLRWTSPPDAEVPIEDFTVAGLWDKLGVAEATNRSHNSPDGAASLKADDEARTALLKRLRAVVPDMDRFDKFWQDNHGEPLASATNLDALRELVEQGESRAAEREAATDNQDTLTQEDNAA